METKVLVLAQSDCHPLFDYGGQLKAHCLYAHSAVFFVRVLNSFVSLHRLQLSWLDCYILSSSSLWYIL